ncbi:MAG: Nif3-like dinuclear metal center hexameric protein [Pseudomonadota bacterium]
MVRLNELVDYANSLLEIAQFDDYCPNGLQVEGKQEISRLATGVTASQALIDAALAWGADAILVHHGFFWKGEPAQLTGIKYRRLRALIRADVGLLAYHLPLDAHPELGNNARLAALLGLSIAGRFGGAAGRGVGMHGGFSQPLGPEAVAQRLETVLGRRPLHIAGDKPLIQRVAWCSGGAQNYVQQAADLGVDAYITGEVSEHTVHIARESGVHFYAAGHHATERYGAQALGEHLARHFSLAHRFFDIHNPV